MDIHKLSARLLIAAAALLTMGMARTVNIDRTGDPILAPLIGREFKTLQDFVLYRTAGSKMVFVGEFGRDVPKREEMKQGFPFSYDDSKILGILPVGSTFRISKAVEEGAPSLTFIFLHATITSSGDQSRIGQAVSPSFLTDFGYPPKFKTTLVEEVAAESAE